MMNFNGVVMLCGLYCGLRLYVEFVMFGFDVFYVCLS